MQDDISKNRSVAYKLLVIEAILTSVVVLVFVLNSKIEISASVFIGGLAFIIPNMYFAKYVFRHSAKDSPGMAVKWFYVGEVIKIFATVMIFTIGFLTVDQLNFPALILTYISLLILNLWGNSVLMNEPVNTSGSMDNNNNGN